MDEEQQPRLLANRWAGALGPSRGGPRLELCECIERSGAKPQRPTYFHAERQDTAAPGWLRLLDLIDEAVADEREVFTPLAELTAEEQSQVVTLPPTIAKLTAVKRLVLYGSNLVRVPPEIGAMRSLVEFSPYTSYRLHWFPYELSRLPELRDSWVSTRALYGSYKYRSHFPPLSSTEAVDLDDLDPGVWGATAISACSVCDGPVDAAGLRQVWISLHTSGADILPLLVNACSTACVESLPEPAKGFIPTPHTGGPHISQPPRSFGIPH